MPFEYLYGFQPVLAALKANTRRITQLLIYESRGSSRHAIAEVLTMAQAKKIRVQFTSKAQLDDLCGARPHQNVALQVEPLSIRTVDKPISTSPLSILLADIIDPQNIGSIIRTCIFLGVKNIYLTQECSVLSPTVSKASAGALESFHKRIFYCHKATAFLQAARQQRWCILGTGIPNASDEVQIPLISVDNNLRDNTNLSPNKMIVFGNEGEGLGKGIMSACDASLVLPGADDAIKSGIDSINVSAAAAIIMSHLK